MFSNVLFEHEIALSRLELPHVLLRHYGLSLTIKKKPMHLIGNI